MCAHKGTFWNATDCEKIEYTHAYICCPPRKLKRRLSIHSRETLRRTFEKNVTYYVQWSVEVVTSLGQPIDPNLYLFAYHKDNNFSKLWYTFIMCVFKCICRFIRDWFSKQSDDDVERKLIQINLCYILANIVAIKTRIVYQISRLICEN